MSYMYIRKGDDQPPLSLQAAPNLLQVSRTFGLDRFEEAEKLMALEKKAEREAATAADKKERAAKQKEAKVRSNLGLCTHMLCSFSLM